MSNRAHRARRDLAEPQVIAALEACGYKVWKLAQKGRPDLLTCSQANRLVLVECKTGTAKHRDTQDWDKQGWPVVTLRSAEEVFGWHFGETVRIAKG